DDGRPVLYGWPDYLDMAAAGQDVAEFAAYQHRGSMLGSGDEIELVLADPVTPHYFSVLGVKAMLGQASVDAAAGQPRVVLGYRLWQRHFASDRDILGKTIILRGKPFVV